MVITLLLALEESLLCGGVIAFLMHVLAGSCYSGVGPHEAPKGDRECITQGIPPRASAGTVQDPSANPRISVSLTGTQEQQTQPYMPGSLQGPALGTLPWPARICTSLGPAHLVFAQDVPHPQGVPAVTASREPVPCQPWPLLPAAAAGAQSSTDGAAWPVPQGTVALLHAGVSTSLRSQKISGLAHKSQMLLGKCPAGYQCLPAMGCAGTLRSGTSRTLLQIIKRPFNYHWGQKLNSSGQIPECPGAEAEQGVYKPPLSRCLGTGMSLNAWLSPGARASFPQQRGSVRCFTPRCSTCYRRSQASSWPCGREDMLWPSPLPCFTRYAGGERQAV